MGRPRFVRSWLGEVRWRLRRAARAARPRRRLRQLWRWSAGRARAGSRRTPALFGYSVAGCLVAAALAQTPVRDLTFASADEAAGAVLEGPLAEARLAMAPSLPTTTLERSDLTTVVRYVVRPGDTLLTIARRFGLSPATLVYNNRSAAALHVGDDLRLPRLDGAIYVVTPADTVDSVAARFGVDVARVRELNRLYFEPENFAPGKTILVPVDGGRFPAFSLSERDALRVASLRRGNSWRTHWPVEGRVTQLYRPGHEAIDVAAPYGSGILADEGVVTAVGTVPVGGLRVCVRHPTEVETCYYHLSATYVVPRERVRRGQVVGAIGLTGVTTGPHVHWEVTYRGARIDPLAR
jgi:murein DD-endopeptidase MepM/ murein hydrolase activator NlpD